MVNNYNFLRPVFFLLFGTFYSLTLLSLTLFDSLSPFYILFLVAGFIFLLLFLLTFSSQY
ncbi:hypothetical protein DHB64_01710 [Antarcticibacterium sp. W02-3]|nr:hypothetical protein [Antarcticibacterium sp. W02-3]